MQGVKESLERAITQRETHHQEELAKVLTKEQQDLHQAFKTSKYEAYKNINQDRANDTCQWLFENSQYESWVNNNSSDLVWISADPGCGKSVLAKSLVDKDLESTSALICYFFFKDNDEQNSLATALCAILHQLFGFKPELLRHAISPWRDNGVKIQQEVDELWRILEAASLDASFTNTYCIVDALDECNIQDRARFIHKLSGYYSPKRAVGQHGWLKFLVTSRPYAEIQEEFKLITRSFPHIRIRGEDESDRIYQEISRVIKIRVADLGRDRQLSKAYLIRIEHQLQQMHHRTYLWLHLAMDAIRCLLDTNPDPEKESLDLIPSSVSDAYKKILNQIPLDQIANAQLVLRIIVSARRPLTIEEMAMALGLSHKFTRNSWQDRERAADDLTISPIGLGEKIRQLCRLFISIHDKKIYLIHQTAKEFLQSATLHVSHHEISFQEAEVEELMGKICVNYLTLYDITDDMEDNDSAGHTEPNLWAHKSRALLDYAARHWAEHVRLIPSEIESTIAPQLDLLYNVTSELHWLWFPIFWQERGRMLECFEAPNLTRIQLAAINGHHNVMMRLLSTAEPPEVMQPDQGGRGPLYWAALYGSLDVIGLMIDAGADVNARGGECGTALQAASHTGHINIVRLLIERGADVNAQDGSNGTALQAASYKGAVNIVQLLIENGANIHAESRPYGTALRAACCKDAVNVVSLLIKEGADVNARYGLFSNTVLQHAASQSALHAVRVLVKAGANVNAEDELNGPALQPALYQGALDIARFLIKKGADVNAKGGQCGPALQLASLRGDLDLVRLIIQKGANVNTKGRQYITALNAASWRGALDVMQLLINKGANVHGTGRKDMSPLQHASVGGAINAIRLLIKEGANVNARSGMYDTALQAALSHMALSSASAKQFSTATDIVRLLIENGANVNAQGGEYGTALIAASSTTAFDSVRLLIEKGADVNAQDKNCFTAL